MNIKHKLIGTLALIGAIHITYGLTPQALNKMRGYEAELKKRYEIIDALNEASRKPSKERIQFKKDGYNLGIESIHKLRDEISNYIKEIQKLDKASGDSKIAEQEKQFKIINSWVADGKVGTETSISIGESKKEFVGISELQHPVLQAIDKLKSLSTSDLGYKSEVELLSSALNRYSKELATYDDAINAQYPTFGFETKGIFLGKHSTEKLVFSALKKQIDKVALQLENATDGTGKKLTNETSKWYESKTIGEYIKAQIDSLKTSGTNDMHNAVAKIARESAEESRIAAPDSPWSYASKKFFVPFLKHIQENTGKDIDNSIGGSFAYINTYSKEASSLTDMMLILDAAESITDYLTVDRSFLTEEKHKKALQDFAKTYAKITAESGYYAARISGDNGINTTTNKDFYNNTILENAKKLKNAFLEFYKTHKDNLNLDTVTIQFDKDIPSLKSLNNLKDTVEAINRNDPQQKS